MGFNIFDKPEEEFNIFDAAPSDEPIVLPPEQLSLQVEQEQPHWFWRMLGAGRAEQTINSDPYQELEAIANQEPDPNEGFWRSLASSAGRAEARKSQQALLESSMFMHAVDAEEFPRRGAVAVQNYLMDTKIGSAIRHKTAEFLPRHHQKRVRKEDTEPLSWTEMKKRFTDGWYDRAGSEHKFTRIMDRLIYTEEELGKINTWLDKHPKIQQAVNATDAVTELGFIIASDIMVGKAVAATTKGAAKGLRKGVEAGVEVVSAKFAGRVDDILDVRWTAEIQQVPDSVIARGFNETIDDVVSRTVADAGDDAAQLSSTFQQVPDDFVAPPPRPRLDATGAVIPEALEDVARAADEPIEVMARRIANKEYIKRIATGDPGFFKGRSAAAIGEIIDGVTFGRVKKVTGIDSLNDVELNVVQQLIDVAKKTPEDLTVLADFGNLRLPVGVPSYQMFDEFGLRQPFNLVSDGLSTDLRFRLRSNRWWQGKMGDYRKTFGRKWNDSTNEAAARILDNYETFQARGADAVLPKEILDDLKPGEVQWLDDFLMEDRALFSEPLADEAVRQGKIGPGTGIDRLDYHFHHHRVFHDHLTQRAIAHSQNPASGIGVLPADYHVRNVARFRVDMNAPGLLERTLADGAYSYDYQKVRNLYQRETLRNLYVEPVLKQLDGAIKTMPPGRVKQVATQYGADWVKFAVRNNPSNTDEALNRLFGRGSGTIQKVVGERWKASDKSWQVFSGNMRRAAYQGAMAGNARTMVKNFTQVFHSFDTIGGRAAVAGMESAFTPGGRSMMKHYNVMIGRLDMAAFDVSNVKGWERLTSFGHQAVDKYVNSASAGNGAMWKLITNNKAHMDELIEYGAVKGIAAKDIKGRKFWETLSEAIGDGHFKPLVSIADNNIRATQWSYQTWDQPAHLWSSTGKTLFQFTSWPSNYLGGHVPRMWRHMMKGEDIVTGLPEAVTTTGRAWQRSAFVRHVVRGASLAYIGSELGFDMSHLLGTGAVPSQRVGYGLEWPVPVSPAVTLIMNLGGMVVQAGQGNVSGAMTSFDALKNISRIYIPGGIAAKHALQSIEEESLTPSLFKPKRKKKRNVPPGGLGRTTGLSR